MVDLERLLTDSQPKLREAVRYFWRKRDSQIARQQKAGRADAGERGAVTGGAQMDGFLRLLTDLAKAAGVDDRYIFRCTKVELPGYYRPTKKWDFLVVMDGRLVAVVETKSQVGSFGNNFNNRTEEAVGSSADLWTAYREGAFDGAIRPWLGYLFLLEECPASTRPVGVEEPHFKVFPEFVDSSYSMRYEILCRKLVRERNYDAAAFLLSDRATRGYREPASDLAFEPFARSLLAHVMVSTGAK